MPTSRVKRLRLEILTCFPLTRPGEKWLPATPGSRTRSSALASFPGGSVKVLQPCKVAVVNPSTVFGCRLSGVGLGGYLRGDRIVFKSKRNKTNSINNTGRHARNSLLLLLSTFFFLFKNRFRGWADSGVGTDSVIEAGLGIDLG